MTKPRIKFRRTNHESFWQVVLPATRHYGIAREMMEWFRRFGGMPGCRRGFIQDEAKREYAAFLQVRDLSDAVKVGRECAARANELIAAFD